MIYESDRVVDTRMFVFDKIMAAFGASSRELQPTELIGYCQPIVEWMLTKQTREFGDAL